VAQPFLAVRFVHTGRTETYRNNIWCMALDRNPTSGTAIQIPKGKCAFCLPDGFTGSYGTSASRLTLARFLRPDLLSGPRPGRDFPGTAYLCALSASCLPAEALAQAGAEPRGAVFASRAESRGVPSGASRFPVCGVRSTGPQSCYRTGSEHHRHTVSSVRAFRSGNRSDGATDQLRSGRPLSRRRLGRLPRPNPRL
jgi:hypothetical protein